MKTLTIENQIYSDKMKGQRILEAKVWALSQTKLRLKNEDLREDFLNPLLREGEMFWGNCIVWNKLRLNDSYKGQ